MNNLLYFLYKWRPWMLFIVYVVVSCTFLFRSNPYQHSVYLTSANSVSSAVYNLSSNVTSYFNLREINEDLQRQNSQLETDLLALKEQIKRINESMMDGRPISDSTFRRYDFIIAHVINNSINKSRNYITINKGSLDGVKPEMGVVDQNGVVGIVNVVGPHSARIISLLNLSQLIPGKVKGSEMVGTLVWDGKDSRFAILQELPRHSTFAKGDTIITSGYSTSFPEGVPIGTVEHDLKDYDDNFHTLRIRLFTDFAKLNTVRLVIDNMADEIRQVEKDEIETTNN